MRIVPRLLSVIAFAAALACATIDLAATGRTGPVRLEGRVFSDDGGPFNPLGATLFWALWGERHDTERLEANLSVLAAAGVDYVRILGMVGAASWEDRVIDPRAPDYGDVADRLLQRLARHGLRAQVTLFADAQVMMPASVDRRSFADAWVARANQNRDRVFALEVANEGWQNGFEPDEMRALGARIAGATDVPVARPGTRSSNRRVPPVASMIWRSRGGLNDR
jgi:hypothetical protein